MMWVKLTFGGFGRRFVEVIAAAIILAATSATVASSLMVVEGARRALSQAVRQDRPDIVQIKSRFNRALRLKKRHLLSSGRRQPREGKLI